MAVKSAVLVSSSTWKYPTSHDKHSSEEFFEEQFLAFVAVKTAVISDSSTHVPLLEVTYPVSHSVQMCLFFPFMKKSLQLSVNTLPNLF